MSTNFDDYYIFKTLNQETRWLGLPLDEFIPAAIFFFIAFFIFKEAIVGVILAMSWIFLLKHMKKGNGSSWLLSVIYWYVGFISNFMKKIPDSKFIHWIS